MSAEVSDEQMVQRIVLLIEALEAEGCENVEELGPVLYLRANPTFNDSEWNEAFDNEDVERLRTLHRESMQRLEHRFRESDTPEHRAADAARMRELFDQQEAEQQAEREARKARSRKRKPRA